MRIFAWVCYAVAILLMLWCILTKDAKPTPSVALVIVIIALVLAWLGLLYRSEGNPVGR